MGCEQLVPGFIALNTVKRTNAICKAVPTLQNFDHACNSSDFLDEVDRRALCELFCCCMENGRQKCVSDVLQTADGFSGYKGYYKAETPYIGGEPRMSRNEPARPTRSRPGGSRIPDVVVVNNPDLPPVLNNVRKVYEMKFPGDGYSSEIGPDGKTQLQAYQDLFGGKIDKSPMDEKSCDCEQRKKERVLEKALAHEMERERQTSLVPRTNSDTAKAVAAAAGATALGRVMEAIGGVAAALGGVLGFGP